MRKKLKALLLFDSPYFTPRGYDFTKEFEDLDWMTEDDVYDALIENGHEVRLLGIYDDINIMLDEIRENTPDVIFNLTEVFKQKSRFDRNMAWLLELLGIPFTGASSATLHLCNNKAISKKILSYHKIRVPHFHTFYKHRKVKFIKRLKLPVIVKPLREEASRGISQASVVDSEEACLERVAFIHERMDRDAIAEEYIEGREFYVSVLGHTRIRVLPLREMKFGDIPDDERRIATYKAKWDMEYRDKWGIKNVFAGRLPEGADKKIEQICKRAYRALNIQSYARFDIRLTSDGRVYILEANANPCVAQYDEFGYSAEKAGIPYNKLVQRIISLAFQRDR